MGRLGQIGDRRAVEQQRPTLYIALEALARNPGGDRAGTNGWPYLDAASVDEVSVSVLGRLF